ncbi:GntR family transcriptional regulator [Brachybacterium tyrofermentans]|uniref:GntR family transcriptional regulator n=1 Tax=Brachybacterium tyrofermentans TaxID=47848 RepID=UPI003FD31DB7
MRARWRSAPRSDSTLSTEHHDLPLDLPADGPALAGLIREGIMSGRLVPNQRLVEADLCAQYEVSRAVVREALTELTSDMLVERVRNRGAKVREVTIGEAIEIARIRSAIEGLAAAQAAQLATEEQIAAMQEIGDAMRTAVDNGDRTGYTALNKRLHSSILKASGTIVAPSLVQSLRAREGYFQYRLALDPDRPHTSLPEHLAIIDAIATRDPSRARQAMGGHLDSVATALTSAFGHKDDQKSTAQAR